MAVRVHITPRGISAEHAARLLGLTLAEFNLYLPELFARGFPRPDVTTGKFDRRAVDLWMDTQSGIGPAQSALC
jgi:hypothetical protein